jgi:cellulose synthase/poly-beta-1,6-N-acetylglucosamine synthase-like glycosyltransferase
VTTATVDSPASSQHVAPGHDRARRLLRGAIVLLVVSPLLAILATRLHNLTHDPILTAYGVLVMVTIVLLLVLSFARYRDPSEDPIQGDIAPKVTALVAVKDEIEIIDRCIGSLLGQTLPGLEVIVVDDGSTDGTTERLRELAATAPGMRLLVNETSQGKKRALTRGVEHAGGDIFVFTDSDCVLEPDAVETLVRAFRAHPEFGALSGHARALNRDASLLTRIQDTWYETSFSVTKAAESSFGGVSCVSGPLAGFRREAIYNYFPAWANDTFLGSEFRFATDRQLTAYVLGNERVGPKLKEQYADSHFVRSESHPHQFWEVGYVRSARVETAVPVTMRSLMRQQIRWKKSFVRNLFFTGGFYWRRGPLAAIIFYGHVLFVTLAPVMVFRHLIWAPLHGALLLTALYLAGVLLKGFVWGLAYAAHNPGDGRWVYRPLMSVMSALCFSWMLPYSALTLRKGVWARG